MPYKYGDPANKRRAKRLMREVLPQAKALSRKSGGSGFIPRSGLASGMAPYLKAENLEALHVYEGDCGGWLADVELKRVPRGVANILGTRIAAPHATRDEALREAICLLASIILSPSQPDADEGVRWFYLNGFPVPVPTEAIERAEEAGVEPPSKEAAIEMLEAGCKDLFGGMPSEHHLDELAEEAQHGRVERFARLMALACGALLAGVLRYPPIQPGLAVSRETDEAARPVRDAPAHPPRGELAKLMRRLARGRAGQGRDP